MRTATGDIPSWAAAAGPSRDFYCDFQFRRLRVRFEPRDDIHQELCNLAEILITFRFLVLYGLV
jgi:hypothetical protein